METLYEKLSQYHNLDIYPMHMPGHKRNTDLMTDDDEREANLAAASLLDITEIDGFDNLGAPEDIIKESMERAAKLYGADRTFYLVNGSTVGLLSGILGSTLKRDKVLVARNCHKAVYNALYLNELEPVYLYPVMNHTLGCYEEILPAQVEEALVSNPDISLVVITSPTYEGIVSDIQAIAEIVHRHNAVLLVDEAHGAHFGMHPYFPKSALVCGADIIIQSLHKTMPAFTQTALLHIKGNRADKERIREHLNMLQSSSPSYVLMAGMDRCISLMRKQGQQLFEEYVDKLTWFGKQTEKLKHLHLYEGSTRPPILKDPSKLVITTAGTNITAKKLYDLLLHKYKIQLEMTAKDYSIAMTSIGDTLEGFERLSAALLDIDSKLTSANTGEQSDNQLYDFTPDIAIANLYEAKNRKTEKLPVQNSIGRISGVYVYQYPPGIPILVPGEVITEDIYNRLKSHSELGYQLVGLNQESTGVLTIQVIAP